MPRKKSSKTKSLKSPFRLFLVLFVVGLLVYFGLAYATGSGPFLSLSEPASINRLSIGTTVEEDQQATTQEKVASREKEIEARERTYKVDLKTTVTDQETGEKIVVEGYTAEEVAQFADSPTTPANVSCGSSAKTCPGSNVPVGCYGATGREGKGGENTRECIKCGPDGNWINSDAKDCHTLAPDTVILPPGAGTEYTQGTKLSNYSPGYHVDPDTGAVVYCTNDYCTDGANKENCYEGGIPRPTGSKNSRREICFDGSWLSEADYNKRVNSFTSLLDQLCGDKSLVYNTISKKCEAKPAAPPPPPPPSAEEEKKTADTPPASGFAALGDYVAKASDCASGRADFDSALRLVGSDKPFFCVGGEPGNKAVSPAFCTSGYGIRGADGKYTCTPCKEGANPVSGASERSYIECNNGKAIYAFCPTGQSYNASTKKCEVKPTTPAAPSASEKVCGEGFEPDGKGGCKQTADSTYVSFLAQDCFGRYDHNTGLCTPLTFTNTAFDQQTSEEKEYPSEKTLDSIITNPSQTTAVVPNLKPPGSPCYPGNDKECDSGMCLERLNPNTGIKGHYCEVSTGYNFLSEPGDILDWFNNSFNPFSGNVIGSLSAIRGNLKGVLENGRECRGIDQACQSGYCALTGSFGNGRCAEMPNFPSEKEGYKTGGWFVDDPNECLNGATNDQGAIRCNYENGTPDRAPLNYPCGGTIGCDNGLSCQWAPGIRIGALTCRPAGSPTSPTSGSLSDDFSNGTNYAAGTLTTPYQGPGSNTTAIVNTNTEKIPTEENDSPDLNPDYLNQPTIGQIWNNFWSGFTSAITRPFQTTSDDQEVEPPASKPADVSTLDSVNNPHLGDYDRVTNQRLVKNCNECDTTYEKCTSRGSSDYCSPKSNYELNNSTQTNPDSNNTAPVAQPDESSPNIFQLAYGGFLSLFSNNQVSESTPSIPQSLELSNDNTVGLAMTEERPEGLIRTTESVPVDDNQTARLQVYRRTDGLFYNDSDCQYDSQCVSTNCFENHCRPSDQKDTQQSSCGLLRPCPDGYKCSGTLSGTCQQLPSAVCIPGAQRCSGNTSQKCNKLGQWENWVNCSSYKQICVNKASGGVVCDYCDPSRGTGYCTDEEIQTNIKNSNQGLSPADPPTDNTIVNRPPDTSATLKLGDKCYQLFGGNNNCGNCPYDEYIPDEDSNIWNGWQSVCGKL